MVVLQINSYIGLAYYAHNIIAIGQRLYYCSNEKGWRFWTTVYIVYRPWLSV